MAFLAPAMGRCFCMARCFSRGSPSSWRRLVLRCRAFATGISVRSPPKENSSFEAFLGQAYPHLINSHYSPVPFSNREKRTKPLKKSAFYFPGLGQWTVRENNSEPRCWNCGIRSVDRTVRAALMQEQQCRMVLLACIKCFG